MYGNYEVEVTNSSLLPELNVLPAVLGQECFLRQHGTSSAPLLGTPLPIAPPEIISPADYRQVEFKALTLELSDYGVQVATTLSALQAIIEPTGNPDPSRSQEPRVNSV
ncbi:MAG: hypothetical protein OXJ56_06690 [Rhodospirillaceae bacterium]|nr:hypothetical protein [Rhodospirillaceae bacterium]